MHVAPQAVDGAFWSAPAQPRRPAPFTAAFVGREGRAKGLRVLHDAWRASGLHAPAAALVLVGPRSAPPRSRADEAVHGVGPQPPAEVRNFLAGADVVVVPSLRTRSFREPWGLVANEAMHRCLPVIASDEVGAAAGGLVRHERNGLIVPAGDADALAAALRRLHDDAPLRARLGAAAGRDVAAFTYRAWSAGFERALSEADGSLR